MNPLQSRLASLRRRLRLQICWRGLYSLVGLIVGAVVLVGLADWLVNLPSLIRALALVTILAAAGLVLFRLAIMPLAARCDDLSLALRIEEHYPDLNDALASTVQFLQEGEKIPSGSSASLRQVAIQRTLALTEQCNFNKILHRPGGHWLTAVILVVLSGSATLVGFFYVKDSLLVETALWRLADPFGGHTWTRIQLQETPHRVAQGQPFVLRGQIAGIVPSTARIEVEGNLKSEKIVPLKVDEKNPREAPLVAVLDMTQQKGKFRFRIHANDAVYPPGLGRWHEVEVSPPPKFDLLNGLPSPQIELRFPAYTDLYSPARLTPGTKLPAIPVGTQVIYRAAFDRPLQNAWIEYRPENPSLRTVAFLAHLGQGKPLNALASLGLSHAVWGRNHARFETDKIITVVFTPWVSGTYLVHVGDADGLAKDFEETLQVIEDPLPTVHLQKPASSLSVVADAEVAFKVSVNDDIYAIRSVFFEYRQRDADQRGLDDGPQRLVLYEHSSLGKALPSLLPSLWASVLSGTDLHLRPKNLEITTKWALKNRFPEGATVILQVGANDFCDLYMNRPAGRSHEIELRIVAKEEIARIIDDGLGKAQQDLVRIKKMQGDALDLIKEIQKKRADNKANQRDIDQLLEAELLQKLIQERLGNRPEEGLREDLSKLQQMFKDNKLPPSKVQDQIKTLKIELDRLAQEDLQQIDPNLAEARKEMIGTAQPSPKNKGPLDKAQKLQEQAKKTLDELAAFLDPWATMHQVEGETRAVRDKQKELRKDFLEIEGAKKNLEDQKNSRPDLQQKAQAKKEELKAELEQKVELQKDLADQTEKLLKTIDKAQKKSAEIKNKEREQKLKKAAEIGKGLPEAMKEVNDEVQKNHPQKALGQQEENIQKLEKMLAALEDRKEDDLDRLQKKHKSVDEVKDQVDKLAQDQDKLRKKTKEANKIENPEERARELKKLAEQQDKLKEEAQKNARELARLQEEQAARALDRAAQEMDQAAQKLDDGQNPDENQLEALDRVEDAQAKLEQLEDELSREQLAKIADLIKGLKERQDAALERSKELHEKVVAKKNWSPGLLETLGGDITSQEGLAGETRSLKEKIKEAAIFEHVFEKAAKAMNEAAQSMVDRKNMARKRRFVVDPQIEFSPLDEDDIAKENKMAQEIAKQQTLASKRLQRLLDSLKNDPADLAQNEEANKEKENQPGEQEGQRMQPGDGVPSVVQLKVLRGEQLELNERTKEFAQIHPDPRNLTQAQKDELKALQTEQDQLRQLFDKMTAAPEKKGGEP